MALALLLGCAGEIRVEDTQPMPLPPLDTDAPVTTMVPMMTQTEETEMSASATTETDLPETAAPETDAPDPVETLLAAMTDGEKVAQLFVVTPETLALADGPATVTGEMTRQAFAQYPVGGLIYLERNLISPDQTRQMLSGAQDLSLRQTGLPLFLCLDEEGGTVRRVSANPGFDIPAYPDMAQVGAGGDEAEARRIGAEMGEYLADLGFNVDFAPVADVLTNPDNRVVARRSFGADPELVARMDAAFLEGLQSQGVWGTYKHFPGHGATAEDSHEGFAVSLRTAQELWDLDLVPFRDGAARGVPFVMAGHITLPNVTAQEEPASLSYELVTGLLRQKIGYEGIVITDSLDMGAISQRCGVGEDAVQAVLAGCDMLLMSDNFRPRYAAVLAAVEDGTISQARLDESVRRILRLKLSA